MFRILHLNFISLHVWINLSPQLISGSTFHYHCFLMFLWVWHHFFLFKDIYFHLKVYLFHLPSTNPWTSIEKHRHHAHWNQHKRSSMNNYWPFPDFFKNNWTHSFFGEIYGLFFFFTFISGLMCLGVGRPITEKGTFPALRLELYLCL